MDPRWLSVAGLILDIAGTIVLVSVLFVTKAKALELGVSRYASVTPEENLKLPQVRDRLTQSCWAKIGLGLLLLGFVLQLIGTWPR